MIGENAGRMSLEPGARLGHYDIRGSLGAGGMGEVYRATDTKLGRDVALKVLPADMASKPELLERFRREARTVAALNHPRIVTIYSVEEADGVHFLAMEVIEGHSLDRLIRAGGLPVAADPRGRHRGGRRAGGGAREEHRAP